MRYFTMDEALRSATALKLGIDNTPTDEHRRHIEESIILCLDPLRGEWERFCERNLLGKAGIVISSGYRGFRLNAAVGGSTTSAHCVGYAFDLVPSNGRMREFKRFCREWFATHPFDQLISEDEGADGLPRWMHVGFRNRDGRQRRQLLSMRRGQYYPMS
ncbi:D-Ala-D-Ala carboxypeptidase family metallohydrolase [Alistipes sp.]|uniref:D-Ala-D-Ala carboxypeptidase family metallohydrolase n=1 Tax=Alistipes sp. TaxID=1872444 RepID=UPI003AEFF832